MPVFKILLGMKTMKKIPYEVEIDIFPVPVRHCRYFQEHIFDYKDDGTAFYEWENIRQNYLLEIDDKMLDICGACPLNLLVDVEGCKGELFDFEIFLKVLPNVKPDSILLSRDLLNGEFTLEETRLLVAEMEKLQEYSGNISWPVAQVFDEGSPVKDENSVKHEGLVYFMWSGEEQQAFFSSNQGYHLGLTNQGIIIRKNGGEALEEPFASLNRKGMRVTGQTVSGKTVPIPINRASLPEWWPGREGENSELRFTSLPVSHLFADIFNMLIVFGNTSIKFVTGMKIFSRYYRP